jgi:hypothetical protein
VHLTDAYKLLKVCRRPVALRSGGIGVWLDVLQCVGVLAVITNCALMGFTSTQLHTWFPNISNSDKVLAIFVFEVRTPSLPLLCAAPDTIELTGLSWGVVCCAVIGTARAVGYEADRTRAHS